MHWLDITILVALGIGAAFGFWSGLLWQIARVVSLFLSLYLAIVSNTTVAEWLAQEWPQTTLSMCRVVAFVGVFLLVFVVLYLFTRMIHTAIKAAKLETVDRILGALLGMLKMSAIVCGACAALVALGLPMTQTWVEQSTLAPHFARGMDLMIGLVPEEYRKRMDENVLQAQEQLQKKAVDAALDTLKK